MDTMPTMYVYDALYIVKIGTNLTVIFLVGVPCTKNGPFIRAPYMNGRNVAIYMDVN